MNEIEKMISNRQNHLKTKKDMDKSPKEANHKIGKNNIINNSDK